MTTSNFNRHHTIWKSRTSRAAAFDELIETLFTEEAVVEESYELLPSGD